MPSGGNTHWCHQCSQAIRLRPGRGSPICPACRGGFIEELIEETDFANPFDFLGFTSDNVHGRRLGIGEALNAIISHWMGGSDRPDQGMGLGSAPWLFFHGQLPARMAQNGGIEVVFPEEGPGFRLRRGDVEHYFVGPGVDELFEQVSGSDRRGPPPASRSAIDAMPTIKIRQRHLRSDARCPVCKDNFLLGSEVREMPCKHLYHTDCIIPWLLQHNSCPVCRYQLPEHCPSTMNSRTRPDNHNSTGRTRRNTNLSENHNDGSSSSEHGGQSRARRNRLSFLWPFRSSNSTRSYPQDNSAGRGMTGLHEDDNYSSHFTWPFD